MSTVDKENAPNKKLKASDDGKAADVKTSTPYDEFIEELKAKRQELDCGYMVVRGLQKPREDPDEESDEEDEEEHKAWSKTLTRKEVDDMFRIIFMPAQRVEAMDKVEKIILGD